VTPAGFRRVRLSFYLEADEKARAAVGRGPGRYLDLDLEHPADISRTRPLTQLGSPSSEAC
jgi:hypothetical protein